MSWGAVQISPQATINLAAKWPTKLSRLNIDSDPHGQVARRLKEGGYQSLLERIRRCRSCPIHKERVFPPVAPKGELDAPFVFYGRNPGRQEGEHGVPFYSKAPGGGLLDQYLYTLGVSRERSYITNSLFCWTKNDRAPKIEETSKCSLWKGAELQFLTQPKFVFLLGNDAVKSFIDFDNTSILRGYGRNYQYDGKDHGWGIVYIVPVLHPGSCLRNKTLKALVFEQLAVVKQTLIDPFCAWPGSVNEWSLEKEVLKSLQN